MKIFLISKKPEKGGGPRTRVAQDVVFTGFGTYIGRLKMGL